MRLSIAFLSLSLASLAGQGAIAQEQNIRRTAGPDTEASTAQVIAEARLKAEQAQQTQHGLLANHVTNGTVSTDCNLQVGGQQTDRQTPPPKTLVGTNSGTNTQNSTVVLGSTVLLCNHP